jgi:hypothetical protein
VGGGRVGLGGDALYHRDRAVKTEFLVE